MREVNSLMVRCPQKELGCDWEGELGQLQQHLNPAVKSRGKGCGFVLIDCVYKCSEQFPRREIHQHELEECLRRPIEVQISSLARKLEGTRVENQFLKKDLSEKLNAVIAENKVIKAENQSIRAENQAIKAENQALQETVKQLQSCVNPTPPFYFTLNNVKHHMQEDLKWRSPPFYSHVGGYNVCYNTR